MNKLTVPISILAMIISLTTLFLLRNRSELFYVDVNKLLEGYERTKVERKSFKIKEAEMNAKVDSILSSWQNELQNYEKERVTYGKKELELKQESLNDKQQRINNYQQVIRKQIQEEDQKLTQTVINDINDYVKEFGEENDYSIIFGAQGNGNIMYANGASDLTEQVLVGLNKRYHDK